MTDTPPSNEEIRFNNLGLHPLVLKALDQKGYTTPTPIQAQAIPHLCAGQDIIGQAQTGTGKTAAFTLPLLGQIELDAQTPQLLIIAPTRELALQVSDAVKDYSRFLKGLHVLPVYGGQGMVTQLRALKKGVHIVVGTPGRLIDHLNRGTLDLSALKALVLDEADEMLRMGFIEDVETIMEQIPSTRITALFSATMPAPIARIAKRFLTRPKHIQIQRSQPTVENIRQSYVAVSGTRKFDALARLIEGEAYDGLIVFTKTRLGTTEVAEQLKTRGVDAIALNGDMNQGARQHAIERFKAARVDILICTDVAARGLDVPRVTHVINYDIPYDAEAYVHRIGRTGRAGRDGTAITFVSRNDNRMLKTIERLTRKRIEKRPLPTAKSIAEKRIAHFKSTLLAAIEAQQNLGPFESIVKALSEESGHTERTIAAGLVYLAQADRPFTVKDETIEDQSRPRQKRQRKAPEYMTSGDPKKRPMAVYRVQVGSDHGLEARNLVGAISNETGIPAKAIGGIRIAKDSSLVELPAGMPKELLHVMKKIWVCGVKLNITHEADRPDPTTRHQRNLKHSKRKASKQSPSRRARNDKRANAHKHSGAEESRSGSNRRKPKRER